MVAVLLKPGLLRSARAEMRQLLRPGTRRLHFNHEQDSLRKRALATIAALDCTATVYDAARIADQRAARVACLEMALEDAADRGDHMLVIEQDDSLVASDERTLYRHAKKLDCLAKLRFEHRRPHEETLLWIPDAIAWCWSRGGDWQRRIDSLVTNIRSV